MCLTGEIRPGSLLKSPPRMEIRRINCRWCVLYDAEVVHQSLEYITVRNGFRVSDVSRELGVTEQHFRRIFLQHVGIPVKQWMRHERMVIARRMLICGVSPDEASEFLGFAHSNSFRREFKEVYRTTVSEFHQIYRRRIEGRMTIVSENS